MSLFLVCNFVNHKDALLQRSQPFALKIRSHLAQGSNRIGINGELQDSWMHVEYFRRTN